MRIVNRTDLPTPAVRKVLHWWLRRTGTGKAYAKIVLLKGRGFDHYIVSTKDCFQLSLSPTFRKQAVEVQLFELLKQVNQKYRLWVEPLEAARVLQRWEWLGPGLIKSWLPEAVSQARKSPRASRETRLKILEGKLTRALKSQAVWIRKSKLAKTKLTKYNTQVRRYRKLVDYQNQLNQNATWSPFKEL